MMRFLICRFFIVVVLPLFASAASAQLGDSAAVYELDEWTIDWTHRDRLEVSAHRIMRVNRSAGADVGRIRIWDTFFQRLLEFEGRVLDTTGTVLFTVGKDGVRAIAPFSEFRLFSGDVVRAVDLVAPRPPYIVEARWTVRISDPFFFPDWVLGDRWPRRTASYSVAVPHGEEIRYRVMDPALVQSIDRTARRDVTVWTLTDWSPSAGAIDPDDATGALPLLHIAPARFRVEGVRGGTASWAELGRWFWELSSDRLELTDKQKKQVEAHVVDLVGKRARASALKEWISEQWRYVAIEVGLGGWRPNKARDVFVNRYGDCKDMVYLWVAMMRHLGLEAHPALVRARNPKPIVSDFPKDWFDHVIGMAIIGGDTLWADPSDPRYPLGTLPRRCESRWALVFGEFGGELVRTPALEAQQSRFTVHCDGSLRSNGDLDFTARTIAGGHFARRLPVHGELDLKAAVAVILGIATPSVDGFLDSLDVIDANTIAAYMQGTIHGWALVGPRQIQLRPSVAGWAANDTLASRPDPGAAEFPRVVAETLIVRFAPGWQPELWPMADSLSLPEGFFEEPIMHTFGDDVLTVYRTLESHAIGRTDEERAAAELLARQYRTARNADWLFRRVGE